MPQQYFNASFRNLAYRLRKFKDIIKEELQQIVLNHEHEILCMIAEDQMYNRGVTGKNTEIIPGYKISTIRRKKKKGQITDYVTLKDTGLFYNKMHVEYDENGFFITSDTQYTQSLIEKYGSAIFRLTNENLSILIREYIRPELQQKLTNLLSSND
nr:MAG TPA: hypothetical protein [Caudoviricetes sp.]